MATALRIRTPIVDDLEAAPFENDASDLDKKRYTSLFIPGGILLTLGLLFDSQAAISFGMMILLCGFIAFLEAKQRQWT